MVPCPLRALLAIPLPTQPGLSGEEQSLPVALDPGDILSLDSQLPLFHPLFPGRVAFRVPLCPGDGNNEVST